MRISVIAFAVALLSTLVYAQSKVSVPDLNPIDTREYLIRFHSDTRRTLNAPLRKWDESGRIVSSTFSAFGDAGLSREEIFKARQSVRDRICASASAGPGCEKNIGTYAAFDHANQVSAFFEDANYLTNMKEMEVKGLLAGKVLRSPWSDSFWPAQRGLISRRWLDREFPESQVFTDNLTYYEANPPQGKAVDTLSPAEKYDLLVGDPTFGLTNWNWAQGKRDWESKGDVPGWVGICHGWAAASIMVPAPKRAVTLTGRKGEAITFYPSDIKALLSSMWANAPPRNYVVGNRCNIQRPEEDEMGRVIDPGCFDVNPGTWHIAIVNQVGVRKESFVIDAQYDFQIWNYPLHSYKYSYFNPQTLETSEFLGGSTIRVEDFTIDKFKRYRSHEAKYVVGVAMEIVYSIEMAPSTRPFQRPLLHGVKFLYDIELDRNGKIVGGEWYSNFHPDFIWHFDKASHPHSDVEKEMGAALTWNGKGQLSKDISEAAKKASANGQPLAIVVEAIAKLAQETE